MRDCHQNSLRWLVMVLLSLALHVTGAAFYGVVWAPDFELPRIHLQEVVGVPIARSQHEPSIQKSSPAAKSNPSESVPPHEEAESKQNVAPPPTKEVEAVHSSTILERQEKGHQASSDKTKSSRDEVPPSNSKQTSRQQSHPADEQRDLAQSKVNEHIDSTPLPEGLIKLPSAIHRGLDEKQGIRGEGGERLSELLVEGSRVVVFLRTDALIHFPDARAVRRTMRAVAGYDIYLGENAFDPLTDFRWMLVRTPDLTVRTKTRLVAGLAVDNDRARASIKRIPPSGYSVAWTEEGESSFAITQGKVPTREWGDMAWAVIEGHEARYKAGPRQWVKQDLGQGGGEDLDTPRAELESVKIEGEPADLVVATSRLRTALITSSGQQGATEAEVIDIEGVILAARLREPAVFVARIWFASAESARRFTVEAQQGLGQMGQHPLTRLLDLGPLIEQLEMHQRGQEVTAWVRLESSQASRLLRLATVLLEREGEGVREEGAQSN